MSHITFNNYLYDLLNVCKRYYGEKNPMVLSCFRGLRLGIKIDETAPYKLTAEYISTVAEPIRNRQFFTAHDNLRDDELINSDKEVVDVFNEVTNLYSQLSDVDKEYVDNILIAILNLYKMD